MKKTMTAALLSIVMTAVLICGCGANTKDPAVSSDSSADRGKEQEKIDAEVSAETADEEAEVEAGGEKDAADEGAESGSVNEDEDPKENADIDINEVNAADKEAKEQYIAFLNGEQTAQTADRYRKNEDEDNNYLLEYGSYTFSELNEAISDYRLIAGLDGTETVAQYAFADFGHDGISDMLIRITGDVTDPYYWVGIIHYDGSKLMITDEYEYGYRTTAEIFTNSFLVSGGSFGAGAMVHEVSLVDAQGSINKCYSVYNLYSVYAENLMYILDKDSGGFSDDYNDLAEGSTLEIRAYTAKEQDVQFACSGWSEDKKLRAREEQMVRELEDKGAIQVSEQKLDDHTKMPEGELFIAPSWHSIIEGTNAIDDTKDIISISIASDMLLERPETYIQYIQDSEYAMDLVLLPSKQLNNFKLGNFEFSDCEEDGTGIFEQKEIYYTLDKLTPDKPLVYTASFSGDMPNTGFYFTDADGNERAFVIGQSGYDGSLYLDEVKLVKQVKQ